MSRIVILRSGQFAQLNPVHSGFAHGFGIFETLRLSSGQLEFWQAHYERFLCSAKILNLHFDLDEKVVLEAIWELVRTEGLRDGVVKLSLLKEDAGTCCYVYSRSIQLPDKPVNVHLDTCSRLNQYSVLAGHKTHNYMEAMYLKQLAQSKGFYDIIRLSTDGFLAETSMANLFFLKEDTLFTPCLSTGILPGVIRSEVLQAAKKHSIAIEEGHYLSDHLKTANAVFLTNSSVGILSVHLLDMGDSSVTYNVSHPIVESLKVTLANSRRQKTYFPAKG